MTTADWSRRAGAKPASASLADEDLAAILRRAAAIGIPAWRVTTALNVPLPTWVPADERLGRR